MLIIDITHPENPVIINTISTTGYYVEGLDFKDNFLIVTLYGLTSGKVRVFDISNPFFPIFRGESDTFSQPANGVFAHGNYWIVSDESGGVSSIQ